MNEVVVTGASGFIGRAVCEELLGRGASVHAVSRSVGLVVPGARHRQVADYAHLEGPSGATCVHLAGESRPGRFDDDQGALAIEVARSLCAAFDRVVFVSSGVVYGDRGRDPWREIDPVDPLGAYGLAKRAAEEAVLAHGHIVARLANVYGAGMSDENVFSDVLRQIPGGGDLLVRNPLAVRDFAHVDDVARALADLALSEAQGTFNIGTGVGTSIGELAAGMAKQSGENDRNVVATLSNARPSWLVLDPGKIKQVLGWEAAIGVPKGIEDLIREKSRTRSDVR